MGISVDLGGGGRGVAHRRCWSARLQKFWDVRKICHREPRGMALVAGELTGAGFCRSGGRDCKWFPETRIMYRAQEVRAEAQGSVTIVRCWYCTYAGLWSK